MIEMVRKRFLASCFSDVIVEMETSVKRIFAEIAWSPKAAPP